MKSAKLTLRLTQKTVDLDQKLEAYDKITDVDDKIKKVTDLANSKVDATYSYSKDELDKKLLALSTDTDGKIDAKQVADMINGKANTNDVYTKKEVDDAFNVRDQKIDTKADKSTTYTKLDIDKALKSIDFGKIGIKGKYLADVNGTLKDKIWYPAKQTDGSWTFNIYDDDHTAEVASNALSKAESTEGKINDLRSSKLNFINASEGYDLLSADGTWGIIEFNNVQDIKNLPPLSNKNW